jgi:glycosyltransferase involved in cell wall biosynthesis
MVIQLVREYPPGYGGVERVAHEMAVVWLELGIASSVSCLSSSPRLCPKDPLPVNYERHVLRSFRWSKLILPLPSIALVKIIFSRETLYVHLPCPGLLLIAILARLTSKSRRVLVHWHAFLDPETGLFAFPIRVYQRLALGWLAIGGANQVITTSPPLAAALTDCGISMTRIVILPCCISAQQETQADAAWQERGAISSLYSAPLNIAYIGRMESYKRIDWLLAAFAKSRASYLHLIGDGPKRHQYERLAASLTRPETVFFYGRLDEQDKYHLLKQCHFLILPSDSCNEAFGIVQLEAMACGLPAFSFSCDRSGAAWVSGLDLPVLLDEDPVNILAALINSFKDDSGLLAQESKRARLRYTSLFSRQIWINSCKRIIL